MAKERCSTCDEPTATQASGGMEATVCINPACPDHATADLITSCCLVEPVKDEQTGGRVCAECRTPTEPDHTSDLLDAVERLPAWLAERGCTLLLPTEDPRDSVRPPFLDAAIAKARGHAERPLTAFRTEHNLSDHCISTHGPVTLETACSGCGLATKQWRSKPDCAFFDVQNKPDTWPLFDPATNTFPDHPKKGPEA